MQYLFLMSLSFASVMNTAGGKFFNGSHHVLYSIGNPIQFGISPIQNWVSLPVQDEKTSVSNSNILKYNESTIELIEEAQKVWVYSLTGSLLWQSSSVTVGNQIPFYSQPTILRIQTKYGIFQSNILEKNK